MSNQVGVSLRNARRAPTQERDDSLAFIQGQDSSSTQAAVPEGKGTFPLGLHVAVILPSSHIGQEMLEPARP